MPTLTFRSFTSPSTEPDSRRTPKDHRGLGCTGLARQTCESRGYILARRRGYPSHAREAHHCRRPACGAAPARLCRDQGRQICGTVSDDEELHLQLPHGRRERTVPIIAAVPTVRKQWELYSRR